MSILKKITPFIKRADEMDHDTNPEAPFAAHYFRLTAINTGLSLAKDPNYGPAPPDLNVTLVGLMDKLEKSKKALPEHTPEEACRTIFGLANKLFYKAEQQKNIDKSTARFFYATSLFYEILDQFEVDGNGLTEEETLSIEYKRKFCKKRATDILNDFKSGQTPAYVSYEEYTSQGNGNLLDATNEEDENKTTPTGETTSLPVLPSIPTTNFEEEKNTSIPQAPTSFYPSLDETVPQIPQAPITPTIPKAPFTYGINGNQQPSTSNMVNNPVNPSTTPRTDVSGYPSINPPNNTYPRENYANNASNTNIPVEPVVPVVPVIPVVPVVPVPSQQINSARSGSVPVVPSIPKQTTIHRNKQALIIDDCYFAVAAAKQGDAHKTEEFLLKALENLRSSI